MSKETYGRQTKIETTRTMCRRNVDNDKRRLRNNDNGRPTINVLLDDTREEGRVMGEGSGGTLTWSTLGPMAHDGS